MPIVDSHCHVSRAWYEPVETLLFQMDRNGVEHAVLIQIMGQTDNSYQTACVRRYPGRFASIVLVDTSRPDAPQELERLAAEGASGVRFTPATRSPGDDPLLIWRVAERRGLAVSCGGNSAAFAAPEFARVIEAVPNLPIVIEHLGGLSHPETTPDWQERRRQVFGLARYPNTFIKIPGLGEFARRAMPVTEPFPFEEPIPPLLEQAHEAFGSGRMMWGSDYPPSSGREGYALALQLPMARFADRSEADRALIFGDVARRVFPPR